MSAPNWNELAEKIHAWAVEKGWWEGGVANRDIAEIVANFHSEVSEAWEEYRAGRMDLWWTWHGRRYDPGPENDTADAKPEGFWVEIADLCIRVLDTAGAYGWDMPVDGRDFVGQPTIPQMVLCLHGSISDISVLSGSFLSGVCVEWVNPGLAASILEFCWRVANQHGLDLLELIELKHRYNCTREYRHGGKLA